VGLDGLTLKPRWVA